MNRLVLWLKAYLQLDWRESMLYLLYQVLLRSGMLRLLTPASKETKTPDDGLWGLKDLPLAPDLRGVISRQDKAELLNQADEIVAGQVRIFGVDPVPLVLSPEAPLKHWTKHRASWVDGHDVKYIWEPARFGWATVLARSYYISGVEKYAAAFWQHTEQFLTGNPPNRGPNWASAQEVALRLIALAFSYSLFIKSEHTTAERKGLLTGALAAHAARIPATLVYARAQNNNHLLTEAVGLYTAGCLLPEHPQAARWQRMGWKWFNRALQQQIEEDGTYVQQSANYHRLMLQAALWGKLVANTHGQLLPPDTRRRLASASLWLLNMLDKESGRVPNLGPNDGAYILPLSVYPFADYRPVVQAAGLAFMGEYPLGRGSWDEMAAWLVRQPAGASLTYSRPELFRMDGEHSWGSLRSAFFSARPGHADQLHFDLWWRGLNIARDAGTYLYNAPPPWENSLMTALVHNTVTVNGIDTMTRAGRFLWLDWTQSEVVQVSANRMAVQHRGYQDMTVRRTVLLSPGDRWQVKDDLIPEKGSYRRGYQARLHWLLPDWEWELSGTILRINSPYGWIEVMVSADIPLEACLARAGERLAGTCEVQPTWGWYSPTYGLKEAALSFAVYGRGRSQVNLDTSWYFPTAA